jgi:hypothetical protein
MRTCGCSTLSDWDNPPPAAGLLPVEFVFLSDPDLNNMALRWDICLVKDGDIAADGVVVLVMICGTVALGRTVLLLSAGVIAFTAGRVAVADATTLDGISTTGVGSSVSLSFFGVVAVVNTVKCGGAFNDDDDATTGGCCSLGVMVLESVGTSTSDEGWVVEIVVVVVPVVVDFSSIGERVGATCVVVVVVVLLEWVVVVLSLLVGVVPVVKLLNICVKRLGLVDDDVVEDVVNDESKDDAVVAATGADLFVIIDFVPVLNDWNGGFCCGGVVPSNSCISCGVKCGLLCMANAMAMAIRISSSSSSSAT